MKQRLINVVPYIAIANMVLLLCIGELALIPIPDWAPPQVVLGYVILSFPLLALGGAIAEGWGRQRRQV